MLPAFGVATCGASQIIGTAMRDGSAAARSLQVFWSPDPSSCRRQTNRLLPGKATSSGTGLPKTDARMTGDMDLYLHPHCACCGSQTSRFRPSITVILPIGSLVIPCLVRKRETVNWPSSCQRESRLLSKSQPLSRDGGAQGDSRNPRMQHRSNQA